MTETAKGRMRRFPAGPLLAIEPRISELARKSGMDRSPIARAVHIGSLTWSMADRLAVACGLHPCAVWPEWFPDDAPKELPPTPDAQRRLALESLQARMWGKVSVGEAGRL